MGKLITASIDVMKINKDLLIKGNKGTYLNLTIWVNDTPDQFGNDVSVEQRVEKGNPKIYLGNGKTFTSFVSQVTDKATEPEVKVSGNDLPWE